MLRNPCSLGVPNAKRRGKFRCGYLTPAFSGVEKRAQVLRDPCILRVPNREVFRSGCLTSAFYGAQKRAEVIRNPCSLRGPQRHAQGENGKWLPHPCLLGGPQEGGSAT